MKKKNIRITIFCFSLFIIFIVSTLIVVSFSKPNYERRIEKAYKFSLFNPLKNETKTGYISIESNKYLSYDDYEKGDYVHVSNFGENDYECSGSCYCDDGDEDRRGSIYARNLIFLVTSLSAIMAISIAKKHFEEACKNTFSDYCSPQAIQSKIDDCNLEKSKTVRTVLEKGEIGDFTVKRDLRNFNCIGYCLYNEKFLYGGDDEFSLEIDNKEVGCEDLWITLTVVADCTAQKSNRMVFTTMKKLFIVELHKFCTSSTRMYEEEEQILEREVSGNVIAFKPITIRKSKSSEGIDGVMCVGKDKIGENPTVNCLAEIIEDEGYKTEKYIGVQFKR